MTPEPALGREDLVGHRFAALVAGDALDVSPPGAGDTARRWRLLADLAGSDLDVARLVEAHLDALAILSELTPQVLSAERGWSGGRWAVWAAESSSAGLCAEALPSGGWTVSGVKAWCSGAGVCTHALVTARADDGGRCLFAVTVTDPSVKALPNTWWNVGMAGSDTRAV